MRTAQRAALAFIAAAIAAAPLIAQDEPFTFTPLDDFEDTSPWIKGDSNTDLTQKDAAVAPSSKFVHEGKQSIAFMISVNWTPREGEQYPKGWPMMSRSFDPPQDWSAYDHVAFWLYTDTQITLPADRALRCGPRRTGVKEVDWYTLPGIEPGKWQLMLVPLAADQDWRSVEGFSFYVAEAWYNDRDRVDFYVDQMMLARRNWPVLERATISARTFPRGKAPTLDVWVDGPAAGARVRCSVSDLAGQSQREQELALEGRRTSAVLGTEGLPPGGHVGQTQLLDAGGRVRDQSRQYFRSMQPGHRTYLSLITFYTPQLVDATDETAAQLAVLNDSAYAGVAVPLFGSYDTNPVPEFEELIPKLDLVRNALKIDPWPWVATNRFIGSPPDATSHASAHAPDPEYFARIPVLDLDNETGARADMMKQWRIAVRAAKRWGSPGIVIDHEAYNNYRSYNVDYVAERRGETIAQVIAKCEAVGQDLARIVEEEYPECIVWTLFSRLDRPMRVPGYDGLVHPVPGHISKGFLDYAREHDLPTKYLCGGEVSVGYYNPNPEALREKIAARDLVMAGPLEEYPDNLFLAGTISPYHDYTILTSWIKDRAGDDPELKTIEDFQPMFRTLFDAYDWVWIYASSAGRTVPYNPDNNARYSAVMRKALDEAAGQ